MSRFMSKPEKAHWEATKWILRYLKGTIDVGLKYTGSDYSKVEVEGYCDSDYAGDLTKRRSLTGYVFTIGGNLVSWKSSLQRVVALSTTEAEYIAITEAVKEALWLKGIINELGLQQECIQVHCDSQSVIHLTKNSMYHERTKHIDVKLHFIRDIIDKGLVEMKKISTLTNPADILMKGVPTSKLHSAMEILGVQKT